MEQREYRLVKYQTGRFGMESYHGDDCWINIMTFDNKRNAERHFDDYMKHKREDKAKMALERSLQEAENNESDPELLKSETI